jgi:hypothetical protein
MEPKKSKILPQQEYHIPSPFQQVLPKKVDILFVINLEGILNFKFQILS